jgi:hypothetical protein
MVRRESLKCSEYKPYGDIFIFRLHHCFSWKFRVTVCVAFEIKLEVYSRLG